MERCPSEANVEKIPAVSLTLVFMHMVTGPYHWPHPQQDQSDLYHEPTLFRSVLILSGGPG
jgi:hypothetical protein